MNQFDNLPKDMIVNIALNYDLATITNFCKSSTRFNDLVCQNNDFWLQKLNNDFGLTIVNIQNHKPNQHLANPTPRTYYLYIDHYINNISNINISYFLSLNMGDLTLVKMALDRGADIQYTTMDNHFNRVHPLIIAYKNGDYDITAYLLERGIINSRENAIIILSEYHKLVNINVSESPEKIRLIKALFDELSPRTIKYLAMEREYWLTVLDKLQEFQNHPRIDIDDIYQRRYPLYLELTK